MRVWHFHCRYCRISDTDSTPTGKFFIIIILFILGLKCDVTRTWVGENILWRTHTRHSSSRRSIWWVKHRKMLVHLLSCHLSWKIEMTRKNHRNSWLALRCFRKYFDGDNVSYALTIGHSVILSWNPILRISRILNILPVFSEYPAHSVTLSQNPIQSSGYRFPRIKYDDLYVWVWN